MQKARISASSIDRLEERIGHRFATHERLVRALTHASAASRSGGRANYERLEFLGDRVLGLCVAEMLFTAFPQAPEGELSVRLNALVSGAACAEIADELELHEFINAGADVKHLTSKRMRSVRADVVESLIAAIYLDAGLDAAKLFVKRYWNARIHEVGAAARDGKTALQEWSHVRSGGTPTYRVVNRTGPDHDPLFLVEVNVDGVAAATGKGRTKRAAEQSAAQTVLIREGEWIEYPDERIEEKPS